MENEHSPEVTAQDFRFLSHEFVRQHFADLNFALLSGRHVQKRDTFLFQLLDEYSEQLHHYYESLYGLHIRKNSIDSTIYYFLDFPEDARGKMASQERTRQLTHRETIIGLMLLKMYNDHFFDVVKDIHWSDIRTEIMESERSNLYKLLFFGDVRDTYSDKEWGLRKKHFKDTIGEFDKLGWVEKQSPTYGNDIHFVIQPSIHRLATLYKNELENFDAFVHEYRHKQ